MKNNSHYDLANNLLLKKRKKIIDSFNSSGRSISEINNWVFQIFTSTFSVDFFSMSSDELMIYKEVLSKFMEVNFGFPPNRVGAILLEKKYQAYLELSDYSFKKLPDCKVKIKKKDAIELKDYFLRLKKKYEKIEKKLKKTATGNKKTKEMESTSQLIEHINHNLLLIDDERLSHDDKIEVHIIFKRQFRDIPWVERNIILHSEPHPDQDEIDLREIVQENIERQKNHQLQVLELIDEKVAMQLDYMIFYNFFFNKRNQNSDDLILSSFKNCLSALMNSKCFNDGASENIEDRYLCIKKIIQMNSSIEFIMSKMKNNDYLLEDLKQINSEIKNFLSLNGFYELYDNVNKDVLEDHQRYLGKKFKLDKKSSITLIEYERNALTILTKVSDGAHLSEYEKKIVIALLESSIGNLNRNKRIRELKQDKRQIFFNKSNQVSLDNIEFLSFRTRDLTKSYQALALLQGLVDKLDKKQVILTNEKITREDYGLILDLVKLNPFLNELNSVGLVDESHVLKNLFNESKRAKALVSKIESQFQKEYEYKPGDILMSDSNKEHQFKRKKYSFEDTLTSSLISKYSHAAQIFSNGECNSLFEISHVYGKYQTNSLTLSETIFADVYRFDICALLSENAVIAAKQKWPEDWRKRIESMYIESQNQLHSNTTNRAQHVENSFVARFKAGAADYLPLGHWRIKPAKFDKLKKKFYSEGGEEFDDKFMICSQFVGEATMASLLQVNEKLKKQIEIDNALKLPFSSHENLRTLHPGRLIELLIKKRAIHLQSKPPIERALFKEKAENTLKKEAAILVQAIDKALYESDIATTQVSEAVSDHLRDAVIKALIKIHNANNPDQKISAEVISDSFKHKVKGQLQKIVPAIRTEKNRIKKKGLLVQLAFRLLTALKQVFATPEVSTKIKTVLHTMQASLEQDPTAITREADVKTAPPPNLIRDF